MSIYYLGGGGVPSDIEDQLPKGSTVCIQGHPKLSYNGYWIVDHYNHNVLFLERRTKLGCLTRAISLKWPDDFKYISGLDYRYKKLIEKESK